MLASDLATLPFRQSYAKVLLTESAAHLREQILNGRIATKAMERGSLFDYLVFGLDQKYEIIDARYRSGDREGEQCTDWTAKDAQLAGKDARKRGLLPVLPCEIDAAMPQAQRARVRFAQLAEKDLVFAHPKLRWRTEGLDLAAEGEPDWVLLNPDSGVYRTVDLKRVASVNPRRLQRQISEMCWDVQGAAYKEGARVFCREELGLLGRGHVSPHYGGHWLIACEDSGIGLVHVAPLDPVFQEIGHRRWCRAQHQWNVAVSTDCWPAYPEEPIGPSLYVTRTELERYDFPEEEP